MSFDIHRNKCVFYVSIGLFLLRSLVIWKIKIYMCMLFWSKHYVSYVYHIPYMFGKYDLISYVLFH